MAKFIIYCIFLTAVVTECFATASDDPFVKYIAGIELLRSARNLTNEQKAAYYKKLCEVTGMSALSAGKKLENYLDNPEQWAKKLKEIQTLIESSP